jgi:hypothetical protein
MCDSQDEEDHARVFVLFESNRKIQASNNLESSYIHGFCFFPQYMRRRSRSSPYIVMDDLTLALFVFPETDKPMILTQRRV